MNTLDLLTKKEKEYLIVKEYKKDSTIFFEGEKCMCVGYILSGNIKIASYSLLDKEVIFNNIYPNQFFGNNLIFSSHPFYKGNVICTEDSKIAFIYKEDLLKILNKNNAFLLAYLEIQSDFGKELNMKIKLLSLNNAKDRLIFFLENNNGKYQYKTINELAKILNLERETLSRTINLLIKEKIITRNNRTLVMIVD